MHIIISGKHLDVGDSLKNHASEFLFKHVKKYFPNAINAHITISKHNEHYSANIIVNEGTGLHLTINAEAHDSDAYRSVELAIKKIEKQLERYKDRIKNHRHSKYNELQLDAKKYIIRDEEEVEHSPTIVAEKAMPVNVLSVRDAVMHMNLQHIPVMVFVNASSYKLSFVYNRADGNIAWVDTSVDMTDKVTEVE